MRAIGLVAVLFQKFAHRQKIKDLGFRKCRLTDIGKAAAFPSLIIFLVFSADLIFGFIKVKTLAEVRNPFSRGQMVNDILLSSVRASARFAFSISAEFLLLLMAQEFSKSPTAPRNMLKSAMF